MPKWRIQKCPMCKMAGWDPLNPDELCPVCKGWGKVVWLIQPEPTEEEWSKGEE